MQLITKAKMSKTTNRNKIMTAHFYNYETWDFESQCVLSSVISGCTFIRRQRVPDKFEI